MSDSADYGYEEDVQDQGAKDPIRAHMRKLEAEVKALREREAQSNEAVRELAFVKAGVDLSAPISRYFVKGYDGEITPEAIRAAAAEANLIKEASASQPQPAEQQAWGRVANAAKVGETSEPVVDWSTKISQARNEQEVHTLMAQWQAEQSKTQ
jgi:hypothetical protein